jgi:hypothetical protein
VTKNGRRTAVIAVSANDRYVRSAKARGAHAALHRPFDLARLLEAVAGVCNRLA